MFTVRQTDCRTGWQVINAAGRPVETYRRRESAVAAARELNQTARGQG
jgi:hypothetical protein